MSAPVISALLSIAVVATELLGAPATIDPPPVVDPGAERAQLVSTPAAAPDFVAGQRERRVVGPLKRGIHELRDPSGWPAEPPAFVGVVDGERFDAAVRTLCGEVAPDAGLPEVARLVREASAETHADPFLLAALAYRESRCRPGLVTPAGVGLLQIQPKMF